MWKLLKYDSTRSKVANAMNMLFSRACIDGATHHPILQDFLELVMEGYSTLTQKVENDPTPTNYLITEVISICSITSKVYAE